MIGCNPYINFGQPALIGRRLTVYDIVTKIYYEKSIQVTLEDYEISLKDVKEAVNYCLTLKCKDDKELQQFCDGCILRTIADGWSFDKEKYFEFTTQDQKYVISKGGKVFFAGDLQELEDSEFGKVTWLLAEDVQRNFF